MLLISRTMGTVNIWDLCLGGGGVLDTNFDEGARLEVLDPDPVPESFASENGTHV